MKAFKFITILFTLTVQLAYSISIVDDTSKPLLQVPFQNVLNKNLFNKSRPWVFLLGEKNEIDIDYNLKYPTLIKKVEVLLQSKCENLGNIQVFSSVDRDFSSENLSLVGEGSCIDSDGEFVENGVNSRADILVTAYSQYIRIKLRKNISKGKHPAVNFIHILSEENYTKEITKMPTLQIIKADKYIESTNYIFMRQNISRISITMNRDFDLNHTSPLPQFLIDTERNPDTPTRFVNFHATFNPKFKTFTAIFPLGFTTKAMRLVNDTQVSSVKFYNTGIFRRINKAIKNSDENEYELTDSIRYRVRKLVINDTMVRPTVFTLWHRVSKENEFSKLVFATKSQEMDIDIVAKEIKLEITQDDFATSKSLKFDMFTGPCRDVVCRNGGYCSINSQKEIGYGCICPASKTGDRCELDAPIICSAPLNSNFLPHVVDGKYIKNQRLLYTCREGYTNQMEGHYIICAEEDGVGVFREMGGDSDVEVNLDLLCQ